MSDIEPRSELEALKIQTDKANAILRSASPLLADGISDVDALESWVKMVSGKLEMGDSEMKRLGDKLARRSAVSSSVMETGLTRSMAQYKSLEYKSCGRPIDSNQNRRINLSPLCVNNSPRQKPICHHRRLNYYK
jgi:hypothetical protein